MNFADLLEQQQFSNGYQLVNGVAMHEENPENFLIPHAVLKKHVGVGHFVELRIDSPRFSVHEEDAQQCSCPSCNGQMTKPILSHEHPNSLVPIPPQDVPSRGWGEDFWVQVTAREEGYFQAKIDNRLVEARLHEANLGDTILFHEDHILAVHGSHRQEIVLCMSPGELKQLAQWLGSKRQSGN
ncbi:MAG: hypothetical protein COA78_30310 [Blastopirellula sp.]|nr:MAG: hypothetical protein COA78_30310 [Blastopirellula sp.]